MRQEHTPTATRKAVKKIEVGIPGRQKTLEEIESRMNAFLLEKFLKWYGLKKQKSTKPQLAMLGVPLSEMDYQKLTVQPESPSSYGKYTMNPETMQMVYEGKEYKIKILKGELRAYRGRPRYEVASHVVKAYGQEYYIPGLEYEKYLVDNPDKIPEELRSDNFNYFMGSTLYDQRGSLNFPCVQWKKSGSRHPSQLYQGARWLSGTWDEDDSVILLEKESEEKSM